MEGKDYFSLYMTGKNFGWVDPTKLISKQSEGKPPYTFDLRVKFFPSNLENLRDDYARYMVVLQLRQSIQQEKIACKDLSLAADLAALCLQSEFGDFDKKQHTLAFVSTFRFLPDHQQTAEFEADVLRSYKNLQGRRMSPGDCESLYLRRVIVLPDYGVDKHTVKGKDGNTYDLGLTPTGILIYMGEEKIGLFTWPNLLKLEMSWKKLLLSVLDKDDDTGKEVEHNFTFLFADKHLCKNMWKAAAEYHNFFRLNTRGSKTPVKRKGFFRLGSSFRASGRTETQLAKNKLFGSSSLRRGPTSPIPGSRVQLASQQTSSSVGRSQSFSRMPSQRRPARASADIANRASFKKTPPPKPSLPPLASSRSSFRSNQSPEASTSTTQVTIEHREPPNPLDRRESLTKAAARLFHVKRKQAPPPPPPTSQPTPLLMEGDKLEVTV